MLEVNNNEKTNFRTLEQGAELPSSLEPLRPELNMFFKKLMRDHTETVTQSMVNLEKVCRKDLRETVAQTVTEEIEKKFKSTLTNIHEELNKSMNPLIRQAEEDIQRLETAANLAVSKTQKLQSNISISWSKPLIIILLSVSLTGAFCSLGLFLMTTEPLNIFLLNEKNKAAYEFGKKWLTIKEARNRKPK